MATYELNSNGFKLKFQGPDDADAYDKKAGEVGACLKDACANTGYRSTLPEWGEAFATKLSELTGIARGVDEEATAKAKARAKDASNVKSVPEKLKKFISRVRAAYAGEDEAKNAELAALAQSVADGIEIDPSPSARASAVSKADLAKAEAILDEEDDVIDAKIDKMLALVPGFDLARDGDNKPEKTSLARLITKYVEAVLSAV